MRNTSHTGDLCRTQVMAAVAMQGKSILVPLSDHLRYDFVFEDENGFFRVQCKNGRLKNGRIAFYPCSVDSRSTPGRCVRKKYAGEVDFFGVYCPDNGKCYLIPVSEAPGLECVLRIEAPRNGQTRGIRWAEKYELKRIPCGKETEPEALQASGSV